MRHRSETLAALLSVVVACSLPLAAQESATANDKLTPSFSKAAMTALADVYRWKERARADAKSGIPSDYGKLIRTRAYEDVRQAQMAGTTEGDQKAGQMLERHFLNVNTWVDKLVEARKNMSATYSLDPDSIDQDPDLVKVNDCEKAFNAMLRQNRYSEIAVCQ
jgi:hypothetical protein